MKLYVLLREDLGVKYAAVQAGHAVAAWCRNFTQWQNGTLVYLSVKDEFELEHWKNKIQMRNLDFAEFREPDINMQLTSIACLTDSRLFSKLRLF